MEVESDLTLVITRVDAELRYAHPLKLIGDQSIHVASVILAPLARYRVTRGATFSVGQQHHGWAFTTRVLVEFVQVIHNVKNGLSRTSESCSIRGRYLGTNHSRLSSIKNLFQDAVPHPTTSGASHRPHMPLISDPPPSRQWLMP